MADWTVTSHEIEHDDDSDGAIAVGGETRVLEREHAAIPGAGQSDTRDYDGAAAAVVVATHEQRDIDHYHQPPTQQEQQQQQQQQQQSTMDHSVSRDVDTVEIHIEDTTSTIANTTATIPTTSSYASQQQHYQHQQQQQEQYGDEYTITFEPSIHQQEPQHQQHQQHQAIDDVSDQYEISISPSTSSSSSTSTNTDTSTPIKRTSSWSTPTLSTDHTSTSTTPSTPAPQVQAQTQALTSSPSTPTFTMPPPKTSRPLVTTIRRAPLASPSTSPYSSLDQNASIESSSSSSNESAGATMVEAPPSIVSPRAHSISSSKASSTSSSSSSSTKASSATNASSSASVVDSPEIYDEINLESPRSLKQQQQQRHHLHKHGSNAAAAAASATVGTASRASSPPPASPAAAATAAAAAAIATSSPYSSVSSTPNAIINASIDEFQSDPDVAMPDLSTTSSSSSAHLPHVHTHTQSTHPLTYAAVFFIVIASVLGSGILGLPVKLAEAGFTPFVVTYTLGFVMQSLVLLYMTELLQRTFSAAEYTRQQDPDADTSSENEADLHTMGKLFLPPFLQKLFDITVPLQFMSILLSYILAASQAYANVISYLVALATGNPFTLEFVYVIVPFSVLFGLLVIFGQRIINAVISVLTFIKGSLLVVLVLVTMMVGLKVKQPISDDWVYIGRPLLIGTVALGGAPFVLPVVFSKVAWRAADMIKFSLAAVSGLLVVFVLNVLWCFYVLRIVPQTGPEGSISLTNSQRNGEISTIPLAKIIAEKYPEYNWVALLVTFFILGSVTVSYITIGSALKHLLDGVIRDWPAAGLPEDDISAIRRLWIRIKMLLNGTLKRRALLYLLTFGTTICLALLNPQAFLLVLEIFTSLALNVESGVFVVLMLDISRVTINRGCEYIPFQVPRFFFALRWCVMYYFVFAIVYDIVLVAISIVNGAAPSIGGGH